MNSFHLDSILTIIPVRDEAETIASVIQALQSAGLRQIRVVDNGSTDGSVIAASEAGAEVLSEPISGYGRACWRGLQQMPNQTEWILFCDGDGSDDLQALEPFWQRCGQFDLILSDRRYCCRTSHPDSSAAVWQSASGWAN